MPAPNSPAPPPARPLCSVADDPNAYVQADLARHISLSGHWRELQVGAACPLTAGEARDAESALPPVTVWCQPATVWCQPVTAWCQPAEGVDDHSAAFSSLPAPVLHIWQCPLPLESRPQAMPPPSFWV